MLELKIARRCTPTWLGCSSGELLCGNNCNATQGNSGQHTQLTQLMQQTNVTIKEYYMIHQERNVCKKGRVYPSEYLETRMDSKTY